MFGRPICNLQFNLQAEVYNCNFCILLFPMSIIECVPNVSEGRRRDASNASTLSPMRFAVRTACDSDYSSDVSHNRSVFTLAGDATGGEQAVRAIYERALAAIDLRTQRGVHPRIGAVDVVAVRAD